MTDYRGLIAFLALLYFPASAAANSLAFVGAVNGDGEGGSGTTFGDGATGNGQECTTYGNGPSTPGFFGSILGSPSGGIGPCGYFGGTISNPSSASFSMIDTFANAAASATASGSAQAALAASSAVVNGQNVTGDFTLGADVTQTFSGCCTSPTTQVQATAAALVDDPNWVLAAPGFTGQSLYLTYQWAITTSISTGNPFGYFQFELGMLQTPGDVNAEGAGGYSDGNAGQTPVCFNCGTGYVLGPGSVSGTGVFTFTSSVATPVGVAVDEEVGLFATAYYNASIDPQATLIGVSVSQNTVFGLEPVTDFTLTTSTGVFTSSGFTAFSSSAPEPGTWLLAALGLAGAALFGKRHFQNC